MIINFVSDFSESHWTAQKHDSLNSWVYSREPIMADIYVIYGLIRRLQFVNPNALKFFVVLEPPEIFEYDRKVLLKYDLILAPNFRYLQHLPNHVVTSGLLSWSIGTQDHVLQSEHKSAVPSESEVMSSSRDILISTIVSNKKMTSLQKKRVAFTQFLTEHLSNLHVYGRGINPVLRKEDVLKRSIFHLAIENSIHEHYWTEKLSDPLLMLNRVFYVGDPKVATEFSSNVVTWLDISDHSKALRIIRETIADNSLSNHLDALLESRRYILKVANVQSRVEQILSANHSLLAPRYSGKVIMNHAITLRERSRFLLNEIRSSWARKPYHS